ncbi:MAG: hypothetical protein AB1746_00115 [Candidatus Zixiibacteriota bacterium]
MPRALGAVLLVAILVIAGYGIYAYFTSSENDNSDNLNVALNVNERANANIPIITNNASNTNSVSNDNTNAAITISGPTTYTNDVVPFSIAIPSTATIQEQYVSTTVVNGTTYPSFTIIITDSRVSGEMVISNRATGFETEQTTSETQGKIDEKPTRIVETTRTTTNSAPDNIRRYLFSPLNSGTMYEEMWISYPIDSQAQSQIFESIIEQIKLK